MLSHYNNLHCSKYKIQPRKMEIFANCNTRTTYLKLTTRKMQVLFVFHKKNIKFVTFYNLNIRSCLHENLKENTPFCLKNCIFKIINSGEQLFAKFAVSKDMQQSRAPSRPPCPRNLYGPPPPPPPFLVGTDSFHTLPQSYQANIAVF